MAKPARTDGSEPESLLDDLTEQLDRTRRLLTSNPERIAESALASFRGEAVAEARIAADLAIATPLADVERFPAAHRLAMRALEVLDREGARDVRVSRRFGPLRPLAEEGAAFVAEWIVKAYAQSVIQSLARLYARREAQAAPSTPERTALARARLEAERLVPGFGGGGIGAPALLAGGAVVPLLASIGQYAGAIDFLAGPVILGLFGALFVLFLFLSTILLSGAGLAHRRSELIMRQPLAALWETIGHAGNPPDDDSRMFAVLAIVLSAVVWVGIPVAGGVLYLLSEL